MLVGHTFTANFNFNLRSTSLWSTANFIRALQVVSSCTHQPLVHLDEDDFRLKQSPTLGEMAAPDGSRPNSVPGPSFATLHFNFIFHILTRLHLAHFIHIDQSRPPANLFQAVTNSPNSGPSSVPVQQHYSAEAEPSTPTCRQKLNQLRLMFVIQSKPRNDQLHKRCAGLLFQRSEQMVLLRG